MMSDAKGFGARDLIPYDGARRVEQRSILIRRGLRSLSDMVRSPLSLEKVLSDLRADNIDVRASAAQAIAEFAPEYLGFGVDALCDVVLELAQNLDDHFDHPITQRSLLEHGSIYYPPNAKYKNLLQEALDSLVGYRSTAIDAVIWLTTDVADSQVHKSIEWLVRHHVVDGVPCMAAVTNRTRDEIVYWNTRYAMVQLGYEQLNKLCHFLSVILTSLFGFPELVGLTSWK